MKTTHPSNFMGRSHRSNETQKQFTIPQWEVAYFEPHCCREQEIEQRKLPCSKKQGGIVWQKKWFK